MTENTKQTTHVDPSALVRDAVIGDKSAIYRMARVASSTLGDHCVVGDLARVDGSLLEEWVRIDRFNHIYKSSMGRHSYTGPNTVIMESSLGRFCSISWSVTIGPGDHNLKRTTTHSFVYNSHDPIRPEATPPAFDRFAEPCKVGSDVWIGANATVLRGIEVGDGAVIGAGAVVTKDIPPYAVVAGVPAKIIRYRFPEEIRALLLKLAWWNWPLNKIEANYDLFTRAPNVKELQALLS